MVLLPAPDATCVRGCFRVVTADFMEVEKLMEMLACARISGLHRSTIR